MEIEVIETPELGDRSYVVRGGDAAVVIDPQRDIDRVEKVLAETRWDPSFILETHIHNDYVSGGYELARRFGRPYGINSSERVAFAHHPLLPGEVLTAGSLRISVVATPGHTRRHVSYVVVDEDQPSAPAAIFSGGSLLYGAVGRTDLEDPDSAPTRLLARAQLASVRQLAAWPSNTLLLPTHGFGSFCSGGSSSAATTREPGTLAVEMAQNPALIAADDDHFVDELVAGFGAYPAYYRHMAPANRGGPADVDLSTPLALDLATVRLRIAAGDWVIDLRAAADFAAAHLPGSVSVPLGTQFATYVGWLLPWGAPLVVIADSNDQIAEARRQLARIGFDRMEATQVDERSIGAWAEVVTAEESSQAAFPRRTFAQLRTERAPADVVLDVRRDEERVTGQVRGSIHVPLHELPDRLGELPTARVWVHCAGGYRAGTAASLLQRAGFDAVHVDDSFDEAIREGLV